MPAYTYYTGSETPTDSGSGANVVRGTIVQVQANDVEITGVQFYANFVGTATVKLWASNGTTNLATASASIGTPAGWKTISFSSPVALSNATTYIVTLFITGTILRLVGGAWPRTAGSLATTGTTTPGRFSSTSGSGGNPTSTTNNEYFVGPILQSTVDSTAPTTPTGLSATPDSDTEIDLSWTASTDDFGVTGYSVERKTGAGSFAEVATPSGTTHSDTGLTASTTYTYRVRARDAAANWSGYSSEVSATTETPPDTTPPTDPAGLTAERVTATQIELEWTASTDEVGVTGYRIERKTTSGSFSEIATTAGLTYTDTPPSAGVTYIYRVRAEDAADNLSGYSAQASAATAAPAPGPGIRLAPGASALSASPSWQRIDLTYNVQAWTIDRGRPNEMSRTDTGTATIELVDRTGDFDPTNPAGAFSDLTPMTPASISLQNPVTDEWATLFRGYIGQIRWVPYRSEQHANVTLELVDAFAIFAAAEMAPDGSFGNSVDDGNIVFNEDASYEAVRTRIRKVLDDAGWPLSLATIFTGNVSLQETRYAPRSTVLSVIQDAADAEFPDVSNVWIGGPKNTGEVVFHGRYARFHPDVVQYDITTWQAGDDTAAAADPADVVRVSPPLVASLDDTALYTSALSTPQNVDDGDIAAQYVTDTSAAADKGLRTWSAENLATFGGVNLTTDEETTALEETKLFADYVRDNYATPRVRVGQLTIKSRRPESVYGPATWALLCGVDISDIVHLTTTHGGGGGFDDDFYVEGIHYTARPGGGIPYVELTLDVSPKGYYDENPFE